MSYARIRHIRRRQTRRRGCCVCGYGLVVWDPLVVDVGDSSVEKLNAALFHAELALTPALGA